MCLQNLSSKYSKSVFSMMLCHYSEHPIVLLYQFGIRISVFCYLSFHFKWLYVLSLIMIMIHDKDVLVQQHEKCNILTSMITWLVCQQELFPLNLCWILKFSKREYRYPSFWLSTAVSFTIFWRDFLNNDGLAKHCVHVTSRSCSRHNYIIS